MLNLWRSHGLSRQFAKGFSPTVCVHSFIFLLFSPIPLPAPLSSLRFNHIVILNRGEGSAVPEHAIGQKNETN
jgi:hypothetical protein